jgi:ParB family transcriptional regulator, chromosome partitioning protein
MSVNLDPDVYGLRNIKVNLIRANERNPRLDFPQNELDQLAESIANKGVLVPIVVFPKNEHYVLVDGERRFRCAVELGLDEVPALVTDELSPEDELLQMFNIHLIRQPWRDIPTARALQQLSEYIRARGGGEPTDNELRDLTGLSKERVERLRYVIELPQAWQSYIREGTIPLNFFWEIKESVIEPLARLRPQLLRELGRDEIMTALVDKRLNELIPDLVSLRNVRHIIRIAADDAARRGTAESDLDQAIRELVLNPTVTIDEVYENTVAVMVEIDKLEQKTASMVAAFRRLLEQSSSDEDREAIRRTGKHLIQQLSSLIGDASAEA